MSESLKTKAEKNSLQFTKAAYYFLVIFSTPLKFIFFKQEQFFFPWVWKSLMMNLISVIGAFFFLFIRKNYLDILRSSVQSSSWLFLFIYSFLSSHFLWRVQKELFKEGTFSPLMAHSGFPSISILCTKYMNVYVYIFLRDKSRVLKKFLRGRWPPAYQFTF